MTTARRQQIHLESTSYYHCVARCVRRAFLCGNDAFSGKNYDHRKQWIVDKLQELTEIFSIKLCAYAVMSNHYHVVLKVDAEAAKKWSTREVVERWTRLFGGNVLAKKYLSGEPLSLPEKDSLSALAEIWRARLHDISWFMRCLNEPIARRANEEEECKGRFWEGRFKSQALLDETAVLTCMTYVDLNPIRAGICQSLEKSDFTSIQTRLFELAASLKKSNKQDTAFDKEKPTPSLLPFEGKITHKTQGLPFSAQDYIELVNWTGRALREDKKGAIPAHIPPPLQSLGIQHDTWVKSIKHFNHRFYRVIGHVEKFKQFSNAIGAAWLKGRHSCSALYSTASLTTA